MDEYAEFLAHKSFTDVSAGFDIEPSNQHLFDFQRDITRWALRRGRAAIFADTGLGKTLMQVSWAEEVTRKIDKPALIIAPLCVAQQTVDEARKFGIEVIYRRDQPFDNELDHYRIIITNYEMIDHFDIDSFGAVVLDESSILKHHDSKTRARLIAACNKVPYRLTCTATPSPNDFMELGSQSEFLGIMTQAEMLAMFFIHDGKDTSKWRLKGHGKTKFWAWLSTWAVVVRKPSDLGYSNEGYDLPGLVVNDHIVQSQAMEGELFPKIAETLQDRRSAQRATIDERSQVVANLANESSSEPWIIWCHLNAEADALRKSIDGAVEVRGSDSMEQKESSLMGFSRGDHRVMITKPSIAGFGLNWQHCANVAFVGLSDSFEAYYQAVRRCYRFGQNRIVNVHLVHAESEGAVKANLDRKQRQHEEISNSMVLHMRELMRQKIGSAVMEKATYTRDMADGDGWTLHNADCIDMLREMSDHSIDFSVYSPPFASLYTYSNSDRDMGNSESHEQFFKHYRFVVREKLRVTKPGRLSAVHCMNLPTSKFRDGVISLTDFRGELIRIHTEEGWIYHSEVTIWKDPVVSMQRTKALGLLHKQLKKDSAMSRQAIPDYLVVFRAPGENVSPITHTNDTFPVRKWQDWASPVWMDIRQTRTLQYRTARESDDERHICPLQLDVIERAIFLWSNIGDMVFSAFAGIGSEGYTALQMGRRFIGAELKPSYYELALKNIASAQQEQQGLFYEESLAT